MLGTYLIITHGQSMHSRISNFQPGRVTGRTELEIFFFRERQTIRYSEAVREIQNLLSMPAKLRIDTYDSIRRKHKSSQGETYQ